MSGMKTASETLPSDSDKLQKAVLDLQSIITEQEGALQQKDARIDELTAQYQQILEQFRLAQQRQFGRSSEAGADQLGLFNESEQIVESADEPQTEAETITYTRNRPKRKPLP
jgi:transposase